jgi:FlaA1/EpsC-like NDP-sugar epimerase
MSRSTHASRCVLVTGAGGYIGSAMVQAIAEAGPRCIVLLDSSEYNLFAIQRNMLETIRDRVPHQVFLGSVNDAELLDDIFSRFHPEIIYHAAAFKHVPLLELNPIAAVENNAIGTWTLAQAAIRGGASTFVFISTDKAVNPHSVLGVSKRIAELAVVALSGAACPMSAIRLVNVIGSTGSVVPIFEKQIAEGGPVTVTHPDASRWFLSLRETVEAVLACGAAACEGRILLPKVGEPRRIAELAEFLIRKAGKDVPIQFIGLRPGDKLTEELIYKAEVREGFVDRGLEVVKTCRLGRAELQDVMEQLSGCVARRDVSRLMRTLCTVVPEYARASAAGV